MRVRRRLAIAIGIIVALASTTAEALNADDFSGLLGYTITAVSTVRGDFEGADFDKPVALDNGMIFEFTTYSYTYSYRPTAVVLALVITPEDLRKRGISKVPDRPITHYKLLVEDELYDVRRVR